MQNPYVCTVQQPVPAKERRAESAANDDTRDCHNTGLVWLSKDSCLGEARGMENQP